MKNKNQRIASILNNIAYEFQQITKILLEVDSVPAGGIMSLDPTKEPWANKPGINFVPSLVKTAEKIENTVTKTVKLGNEWSTKKNKWVPVYQKVTQPVQTTPVTVATFTPTSDHNVAYQTNSHIYYKRLTGLTAGSIVKVHKKSKKIVEDGAWNGSKTAGRIALVTTDKMGRDYVASVRSQLRKQYPNTRIVRYYRGPWFPLSKYPVCAVYTA